MGGLQLPSPAGPHARFVVVGAAGFLGRAILRELAGSENEVVALSRTGARDETVPRAPNVTHVALDLSNAEQLHEVVSAVLRPGDRIINAAAAGVQPRLREEGPCFRVNTLAPLELYRLAAAAGARRFMNIGTCEEYGRADTPHAEAAALAPEGIYAISKAAGSTLLLEAGKNESMPGLMIARPFGTWGEGEASHRLAPMIVAGCVGGQKIPLSQGLQVRDMACVTDVARVLIEMASDDGPDRGEVVNIGSGQPTRIRDFARAIAHVLDGERWLAFGEVPMRAHEMPSMLPDVGKLRHRLGWLPRGFVASVVLAMRDAYKEALQA